jgi:hypothetical protein
MEASSQRTWQVRLALMLIIGVAAAAACVATLMLWKAPVAPAQTAAKPNIIFIITWTYPGMVDTFPLRSVPFSQSNLLELGGAQIS